MKNPSALPSRDPYHVLPAIVPGTVSLEQRVPLTDLTASATGPEQHYRAGFYGLLAALLRCAPDQTLLNDITRLASVKPENSELTVALSMLGLAATSSRPDAVADEYHDLFIGLGRGELVPYGSWYQTGFLMERPLGLLRDDLARLGYQREADVFEPEDHVAALCEVMMFMIDDGLPLATQAQFFETHLASWVERFFHDLGAAHAAVFYRAVGRFGLAWAGLEQRYLDMQA